MNTYILLFFALLAFTDGVSVEETLYPSDPVKQKRLEEWISFSRTPLYPLAPVKQKLLEGWISSGKTTPYPVDPGKQRTFEEWMAFDRTTLYPQDVSMTVYPEKIHFGDVCFVWFEVTNQGEETLYLPYGNEFYYTTLGYLLSSEEEIQFLGDYEHYESPISGCIVPEFPGRPVKPNETMTFFTRSIWLPMPEFAHDGEAVKLYNLVDGGMTDYSIWFRLCYRSDYCFVQRPLRDKNNRMLTRADFPADELTFRELEKKGWTVLAPYPGMEEKIQCNIRVLPRSPEVTNLIQAWYLELPLTSNAYRWTPYSTFSHPFHARNSPFKVSGEPPNELYEKRKPLNDAYHEFFTSMLTRTPEMEQRIKRTNELAAELLKLPDEELSRNMKEFIQIRGFLVNMRYAENEEAEKKAFGKLMAFVEKSQDKALWVNFIYEVALENIQNSNHFPQNKVESYRGRFAEQFPMVRNELLK